MIFEGASLGLLNRFRKKALELLQISLVKLYMRLVNVLRRHAMILAAFVFFVGILAVAFVVIPTAIIIIMPWSIKIRVAALIAMGCFYFIVTCTLTRIVFSEKYWMKLSGAEALMNEISKEQKK